VRLATRAGYCPSGTKVHGVFGGILEDSGDAFLDQIRPGNLALEDGVTYMTQAPSAGPDRTPSRLRALTTPPGAIKPWLTPRLLRSAPPRSANRPRSVVKRSGRSSSSFAASNIVRQLVV
jgi:hypothetical protein